MDIPAANGVRQPALQSDSTDPGWRPIIPHAEEDAAALEIHPRRNLFRPLPRACHYHTVDAEIIVQFRGAFRPFSSVGVRQCLA